MRELGEGHVGVWGGASAVQPHNMGGVGRRDTQEHTHTHTGTCMRMLHLPFSDLPLQKCPKVAGIKGAGVLAQKGQVLLFYANESECPCQHLCQHSGPAPPFMPAPLPALLTALFRIWYRSQTLYQVVRIVTLAAEVLFELACNLTLRRLTLRPLATPRAGWTPS